MGGWGGSGCKARSLPQVSLLNQLFLKPGNQVAPSQETKQRRKAADNHNKHNGGRTPQYAQAQSQTTHLTATADNGAGAATGKPQHNRPKGDRRRIHSDSHNRRRIHSDGLDPKENPLRRSIPWSNKRTESKLTNNDKEQSAERINPPPMEHEPKTNNGNSHSVSTTDQLGAKVRLLPPLPFSLLGLRDEVVLPETAAAAVAAGKRGVGDGHTNGPRTHTHGPSCPLEPEKDPGGDINATHTSDQEAQRAASTHNKARPTTHTRTHPRATRKRSKGPMDTHIRMHPQSGHPAGN